MPIKSSPAPLAISEIVTEFGDSAGGSDSLSEYYRGGANVNDVATNNNIPTSGAIDIGDFYGAGNAVSVAASAGTDIDVAPLFASPATFTNAVSKILTIAAPIAINGNNVALTVPSNLAGTLDIQNAGTITGSRGTGGNAVGAGCGIVCNLGTGNNWPGETTLAKAYIGGAGTSYFTNVVCCPGDVNRIACMYVGHCNVCCWNCHRQVIHTPPMLYALK